MVENGIVASALRKEDQRFLTGKGRYVDDHNRPGQLHASFVRSPHAHATINGVNIDKAKAAPGVVEVLTGADVAADGIGGLPCGWGINNKDGSPMHEPTWPILAADTVRYVGDAVAVVIAGTPDQARDGRDLVEVDYSPQAATVDTAGTIADGSPLVWPDAKNNICFDWEIGDAAATDAAIGGAHHVAKLDLINQRLIPHAMEPRSALTEFDSTTNQLTLYCTSQAPHVSRLLLGAFVLQHPEHKFRVVSPDVGGAFGSKIYPYHEYAVLCWASRKTGLTIKWTSERSESFLTDAHGRDHVTHVELGLDKDGNFVGLRIATIANFGAYLSTFAPLVPTFLYATLAAGQYKTPAI